MEWYLYIAVIAVGFTAGFINTLAGGGSAISLPMLIFLGLPANVANGTNRIAIILQNIIATTGFKKAGVLDFKIGYKLGIVSILGAVLGALIAVKLNEALIRAIIGVVLLFMLVLIIFKPDIWIKAQAGKTGSKLSWLSFVIFFIIGAYGGFIQVGVGFFLLGGLVLHEKLDLVKANAIKVFIILLYTPLALVVFILQKQVDYKLGLVLAIGNMLGAWTGSKVAVSWGPKFVRWVLIVSLLGSAIKLFWFSD
ncbi:MAG: sulfite exporter TauE/SafE family protein [Bacteroidales bacterium]|nr:sulfite exporter TauE/SafE family protein [Bacteroidales bacterium]